MKQNKQTIYRPKAGSRLTQKQVDAYGPALHDLMQRHGEALTPKMVVAEATAKRSPLHSYFEWNDRRAAEQHRLNQARYLLRSIVIIPVVRGKKSEPIRAFFNVHVEEQSDGTAYVPTERVGRSRDLRRQVIEKALREAEAWWWRYGQYDELAEIGRAIERILASYPRKAA